MKFAIDENVLAVANDVGRIDREEQPICQQASDECRLACVEFLGGVRRGHKILIDDRGQVLAFYRRKASLAGQPGSADAFLKFLYDNQYNGDAVELCDIGESPSFDLDETILESMFDPDDRIYVALVLATEPSELVNAVDTDYEENAALLSTAGVVVRELCLSGECEHA